ncbi:hypothetical protein, partial [uncultured Aliiroseovarius sp.]|uniref:hypothetical protein n=1 Tax=uncultured Aliiroseovarius sp. TaxID=1658783 RepID=UPI0026341689
MFIEMNQTAHISLQIPSMSKSVEQKAPRQNQPEAPYLTGATRVINLKNYTAFRTRCFSNKPSRDPTAPSAPPVKGVLGPTQKSRNPFFPKMA